jgi:hypothetical protein
MVRIDIPTVEIPGITMANDLSDVKVSTTTPLDADATFTSSSFETAGYGKIVGSVFADQPGTLHVDQSNDETNWDSRSTFSISANTATGFVVDVVGNYARIVYENGSTAQTVFRLYVRLRRI